MATVSSCRFLRHRTKKGGEMASPPSSAADVKASSRLGESTLQDVEAMRLLLKGGSVIDWHRLAFHHHAEVSRFLRLNEFDPRRDDDLERLEVLREEAVEYLQRNFGYHIPAEVAHELPVFDLFLLASSKGRRQLYACLVLKAMHVMHHLAGRELLFKLPVSDDQVFGFVEAKVVKVVEELRGAGFPIVEFAWSRKERDSVVTKLLAKKESIAAHVYDKLRFRLITKTVPDLIEVLYELLHRLIPFNYITPGESVNGILNFRKLVEETPGFARYAEQLQRTRDGEDPGPLHANEFSGPTYRVINFIADLPVRIDSHFDHYFNEMDDHDLGAVIFVLTEFQVMDEKTAHENEAGDNSHSEYKLRQHQRVKARLEAGQSALIADHENDDDSMD
jgi:uncharacterized protein (TIGR04552 family)